MPRFSYLALDAGGTQVKGEIEALNESALRTELLRQNLDVVEVKTRRRLSDIEITPQRVPLTEVMHFSRQLSAFVRAGIPVTDGLDVIAESTNNKRFREILWTMREAIREGVPFGDALAVHADILPPYYLGIVRSAELTGRLDVALEQLSGYIERELEAKSKIKQATTYPAIVFVLALVTIGVLTVYVLPKFADFFDDLDTKLPLTTRMIVALADFSKDFWYVFPALFAAGIGMFVLARKTDRGRRLRDRALLRIPVVKDVVVFSVVERVCRILAAMSQAGVPLPEAMASATVGANNTVFEARLEPAHARMLEGDGLAAPIEGTQLFPRAAVQMMKVGENTGTLDQQLENAADFYSHELEYKLKRLTTMFEPAVIIFMGVIVGFVALALVQAMYGIYDSPALDSVTR